MQEKEKTLMLIKEILNDDDVNIDSKLDTLINTVNYNNEFANKATRNINIRIFSETEAIMGAKQDLNLINDINEVDQIRYIFSHEKDPIYLGRYDGIKDEMVFTKQGLELFFPLGSEFVYTILNKCKKENSKDKALYKDIVDRRRISAQYRKEPEKMVKEGYSECVCCKMIYPLTEDYFSLVGGVISNVNRKKDTMVKVRNSKNKKKSMNDGYEEIDIEVNDEKYNARFLNICKKCELVRVNDEFYRQRLRDRKGKWLKKNTLMTTDEILGYDIDKIPDISNVALYERHVESDLLVPDFNKKVKDRKIRCVETGKVFMNLEVAGKYLGKEHAVPRIRRVLDDPNKVAYDCHWVTIIDD